LATSSGRGRFSVARYNTDGPVLLLSGKEAWTPLPRRALEEVPNLLRGRGWVLIGSVYSVDAKVGCLDEHLNAFSSGLPQAGSPSFWKNWSALHRPITDLARQATNRLVTLSGMSG
jgi:hypothetical protein